MASEFRFLGRSSQLLGMIFYKLMLALVEMMAGAVCLIGAFFARHPSLMEPIERVATDNHLDRFVVWVIAYVVDSQVSDELLIHIGIILIVLGIIKIFISAGLWFKSELIRKAGILLFSGLACYSIYKLTQGFSVIRIAALLSDLFFAYYFWRILPKHIRK